MRMKIVLHVFIFAFITGCVSTHVKPDTTEQERETKQALTAYTACLNERSELYAPTANTPSDIADAILYDCGRQLQEYRAAVKKYLDISIGPDNSYYPYEVTTGLDQRIEKVREESRRLIISKVLQYRNKQ